MRSSPSTQTLADAIGVVRFVIENQDVLLATDLPAENAIDQCRVTLDIAHGLYIDLAQIALGIPLLANHRQKSRGNLPV